MEPLSRNDLGQLVLDPFSFHVNVASRIKGLGGDEAGHDPTYAFHTPYVEAAPGPATFILRFRGLKAKQGVLQLWVNMLPNEPGSNARVANSDRIQLNRVIKQAGEAAIKFEGFVGVRFALHGQLIGDTDAVAEDLIIVMDRPLDGDIADKARIEARSSSFGRDAVESAAQIVSLDAPIFAWPISQMATEAQLKHPDAQAWVAEAGISGNEPARQWSTAYILQTLQTYGMLEKGAVGLGMTTRSSDVANLLRAKGLLISLASPAGDDAAITGDDENDAVAGDNQTFRPDDLPDGLVNFDFLWSEDLAGELGSISAGVRFIETSIGCLRPGGMAVHVFPFTAGVQRQDRETFGRRIFERGDVERMALIMISRRFEVAQIKIKGTRPLLIADPNSKEPVTRFGLIVRRPPSAY